MGASLRVFLILEDDQLVLLPLARYERLNHGDPGARLPEFAGKKVRAAVAHLDLHNRELSSIWRLDYDILHFDEAGGLDKRKAKESLQLAVDILGEFTPEIPAHPSPELKGNVIHAKNRFIRKRFTWKPSKSLTEKIVAAVYRLYGCQA
jgi:hypothetical protein